MPEFQIEDAVLTAYHGTGHYVEIPNGVRVIGEGVFRDCREIREITIPESVEEICTEAFHLCVNLQKIIGAKGVTRIGRDVFTRTPWYKYYSENETEWKEDFAFVGRVLVKARRNLREARIPEGTSMIAADAFYERVMLQNVEIPSTVTYLGWRAFKGCSGLTKIRIPGNV